ncbi:MAG TPA: methyltransferase domain-containing protein [Crenotrichaceae bacterium]|nr:methyltransferase domain-containing protein [Crenotrichaceae bacterium]
METLTVPQGSFHLCRYPLRHHQQFRAWDAADEYILQHVNKLHDLHDQQSILILNDSCGALSIALATTDSNQNIQMMSDSWLAHQALLTNLKKNNKPINAVKLLDSLQSVDSSLDLVLIKIPKSLALLEDQLYRIRPHLDSQTRIVGAGMVKHIHRSTLKLFERIIGVTKTSLAKKKARLIYCDVNSTLKPGVSPYPKQYRLENTSITVVNHANVFSQDSLDIGTRFFLKHISSSSQALKIVDLGCGNGLLGLIAAQRNPQAELIFTDESYMAISSAQTNFRTLFGDHRKAEFMITNCLKGVAENSVDLILNNPPFHLQNAVSDTIARQMFAESSKALKKGGIFVVIGNRHLGYHAILKRLFGQCEVVESNHKFVVLQAIKQVI